MINSFKKASAVCLVIAMLMSACGGDTQSGGDAQSTGSSAVSSTGSSATTGGEKTVVVNLGSEPPELNTILTTDTVSGDVLRHTVEGLVRLDADDNPVPGMAESWEVSEDNLTYTFKLRKGAKWDNGEPVTAKDFVFAYTQVLTASVASQYSYHLYGIENAKEFYEGKVGIEEVGFKAIDDYTLQIKLHTPEPYFLGHLAFYTFRPVNEKFYNEVGADKYAKEAEYTNSNGPFKISSWTHNDEIVLTKREDYWDAANVKLDKIVMKMIIDSNTAMNAFLSGDVQMVGVKGQQRDQYIAMGYDIKNYEDGSSWYLQFQTKSPLLKNAKIRKALAMAVDVDTYIKTVVKNDSRELYTFTPHFIKGYDGKSFAEAAGKLLTRDAAQAKKLFEEGIKEAGLTIADFDNKLKYLSDDGDLAATHAAYIQNQIKQNLGFTMVIEQVPFKTRLARMHQGDFDIVMAGWGPDYDDPMTFLDMWVTGGGQNTINYSNPKYDELIEKARKEQDLALRQSYLIEVEKIIAEDVPIGTIYERINDYVTAKELTGVVRTAFQSMNLTYADITG